MTTLARRCPLGPGRRGDRVAGGYLRQVSTRGMNDPASCPFIDRADRNLNVGHSSAPDELQLTDVATS
jgi:hypothetical protein